MSSPSRPDASDKVAAAARSNTRGLPLDRARIDSDVRAFLRPASSPWIVFDRDSRVDDFGKAALRLGAVFASRPSFRSEMLAPSQEARMEEARPEPSGMAVAADVLAEPTPPFAAEDSLRSFTQSVEEAPVAVPVRRLGRATIAGMVAGAIAVAACVGLLAKGMGPSAPSPLADVAHAAAVRSEAPAAPPAPAEARGEAVAAPPSAPPAVVEAASAEPAKPTMASRGKHRFGKLTLKRTAAHKNVWFDGKRMLGSGRRSFTVFCGMHTIAVGEKADAKDVEVPCNGEFVVAR